MSKADANGLAPCRVCGRRRPIRFFNLGMLRALKSGESVRNYAPECRDCQEKARRAAGVPVRHQRRNARGDYWCNNCRRYRDADHFRDHPSKGREGTKWSFCRECERALDRLKHRKRAASPQLRARDNARRNTAERRASRKEARDRRETIETAIRTVLDRGLTKAEICRLVDCTIQSFLKWERGEIRFPTASVAARFLGLQQATTHLKDGQPAPRRRSPHPDLAAIETVMARVRADHRPGCRTGGANRATRTPIASLGGDAT